MATEKEITELADKIIQHGTIWLKNAKSTFDAVPYVEEQMQLSQEAPNDIQELSDWNPSRKTRTNSIWIGTSERLRRLLGWRG